MDHRYENQQKKEILYDGKIDVLRARKESLKQFQLLLLGEFTTFTGIVGHGIVDAQDKEKK